MERALLQALHDVGFLRWLDPSGSGTADVTRVLRALAVATLRNDGTTLRDLGRVADKHSRRMLVARREEARALRELTYTDWQPLGAFGDSSDSAMAIVDEYAERGRGRADFVLSLVRCLEQCAAPGSPFLGSMKSASECVVVTAYAFVETARRPAAHAILAEHGITLTNTDAAIAAVTAAYKKVWSKSRRAPGGERLLVAGYRALGLSKQHAENLKDSIRKREERSAR